MEIEFVETPYELEKLIEESLKSSFSLRNARIFTGVISILGLCIGVFIFITMIQFQDPLENPVGLMIVLVMISIPVYFLLKYFVWINKFRRRLAKKTMQGKNIKSYLGKNKIRINKDGIHRSNLYRDGQ